MKGYDLQDWPKFDWSSQELAGPLAAVRHRQGRLLGRMEALGFDLRAETALQTMTEEVVKSGEIEGEALDKEQVRSSIARRLHMNIGALASVDRDVEGIVETMLDATQDYRAPFTNERLFAWHALRFPTGRSVGAWRDGSGPIQLVSGPIGQERVHYEAPPAARLEAEMTAFLDWFNADFGESCHRKRSIVASGRGQVVLALWSCRCGNLHRCL